jgi:hypothetical protein
MVVAAFKSSIGVVDERQLSQFVSAMVHIDLLQ